ncbi:methyltransferase family protein [Devosia lacusdianchii]|uniref:methyltransferase family protein n=1 Tax=Devosia lacusdianchii TaxID=2917991 RepID=UPI001F06DF5F|nr:isoprenylcysteine carboxylmethyltransferase family protein [Devosia sp. JXJ CY 41]
MELIADLVVTVVSIAILAQHVWALRGHFASETMANGARVTSAAALLTCACLLLLVWTHSQPIWAQVVGVLIELGSLALFWAAIKASRTARLRFAFDDQPPHSLVTIGPYQYVRHPFYTSYLLFWIGWAIATWSLWSVLPLIIVATLYVLAARMEERLFATTALADEYAAYRQRAGLFWPRRLG